MKKLVLFPLVLAGAMVATPTGANANDGMFTGDTRLACEAILCLATGTRPSECSPSLRRYFSINHRRLSDTLRARKNFLGMCPAANQDEGMQRLVNDIANGAGRCDAASLNASNMAWRWSDDARVIGNTAPGHCASYHGNPYTDLGSTAARYVGTPERGGYWVDAINYEQALREYNERLAREDAHRQSSSDPEAGWSDGSRSSER